MLYRINCPNDSIKPDFKDIITSSEITTFQTNGPGYSKITKPRTIFHLFEKRGNFILDVPVEISGVFSARFYQEENHGLYVKLSGLELINSEGRIIPGKQFAIRGYEFRS